MSEIERLTEVARSASLSTPRSLRYDTYREIVRAILTAMREIRPVHYSDCALHMAPAYVPGDCDCGAIRDWQGQIDHILSDHPAEGDEG